VNKIEYEHNQVMIWGTLSNGKPVQIGLKSISGDVKPGKWIEVKGLSVERKAGEPFFYCPTPPGRQKNMVTVEVQASTEDVEDFDDSFYIDQKCDWFGIGYDSLDNDCDDCMFSARCQELTEKLKADVSERLAAQGRRPQMIQSIPSWKDTRKPQLIVKGNSGEVSYDGYHRCKVCNGNVRIIRMSEGEQTYVWAAATRYVTSLRPTDDLFCPHCKVGRFHLTAKA